MVDSQNNATMCTLCGQAAHIFDINGIKIIKGKEAPYRLCRECCNKIRAHNAQIPAEAKKRQEIWEKVWKKAVKLTKAK